MLTRRQDGSVSTMRPGVDPYAALGVAPGATDAAIHAGYRAAVRRTHPDAGGSAAAFEDVQEAYELLRDPGRRRSWDSAHVRAPSRPRPRPRPARAEPAAARKGMEDLLAESQRLEDEARRLAGMRPLHGRGSADEESQDSIGAVLHDAGEQLLDAADRGVSEVRRFIRRISE
jgi:curved DNA-binding protein CbpA